MTLREREALGWPRLTVKCRIMGLKSPGPGLLLGLDGQESHLPIRGAKALDHPVFSSPPHPISLQCVALSWSQNKD